MESKILLQVCEMVRVYLHTEIENGSCIHIHLKDAWNHFAIPHFFQVFFFHSFTP